MRFLLRPGWVALTVGVVVFAIACFTLLAPWQMSRHEQKKAQNDAITTSIATAPVPVTDVDPASGEWRQVTLTGVYVPEAEVVARLRTVQGEPAFEVLTPEEGEGAGVDPALQARLVRLLARASGESGMAGGQAIDLASVGQALDEATLRDMHQRKTGALLRASVQMGAACGGIPTESPAWTALTA